MMKQHRDKTARGPGARGGEDRRGAPRGLHICVYAYITYVYIYIYMHIN